MLEDRYSCETFKDFFITLDDLLPKLTIYRKNFNKETECGWKKSSYYLSDSTISKAFYCEKSTVGVFSTYQTKFFVIDIDNHDNTTNVNLLYSQVYTKLGEPSLVCRSPRGLHVYYFIKEFYDANLLTHKIKKILNLNVEVKPTPNCSIRFINSNHLLNPITLESISIESINEILEYNVNEFLYAYTEDIKLKKDSIDIIFAGETNDALNNLIPQWKSQGFTDEECCNKFIAKLDSSYTGDCRNFTRLLKRVKCYKVVATKRKEKDFSEIEVKYSRLLNDIESYFKLNTKNLYNKSKRIENIRKFVCGILYAKEQNLAILDNQELLSAYVTKYKYFKYEVSNGNIPLSSTYLKSIVSNYNSILNYLILIGFIRRKNSRSYDSINHSCQYYCIDEQCMYKYTEFSYSKLVDTNVMKRSIKDLFTSIINFTLDVGKVVIDNSAKIEDYLYRRFNMFIGCRLNSAQIVDCYSG